MPTSPKRPCAQPGCPKLVERGKGGYCDEHQRPAFSTGQQRASARERGYDRTWELLRAKHLRDYPDCMNCGDVATEVDHRIPFRRADGSIDDGLRLEPTNLQSLCTPCHRRKTAAEAVEARRRG
jgi:5-methylcytosine-specific restriction enzyme A